MPGIVGLITSMPPARAIAELKRMLQTMQHEPSYLSGVHHDAKHGVYGGWVARTRSFDARMPLRNESGDVTLLFSGEDFPAAGIRGELARKGHNVDATPASYLVHLYEEDAAFPANLNGRFQGLAVDARTGRTLLFNDRYGMQRIYYHQSADAFYFAAEAKAILAVCPELRELDLKGLGEYASCGCVLNDRSLFKGIRLLPPASAWTFENGSLKEQGSYFHPREWEEQEVLAPEAYYGSLKEVFARTVGRYFNGEQPVGVSLTGGLDSRMIMAWRGSAPRDQPCYSFGGMYRDCQDVAIARKVAEACGQTHQVIPVGQPFLSQFGHYAERSIYLTDGCIDVSHSPDLYVNERAAQIAPVRLTGNYGGEILRRVRAFKPMKFPDGLFAPDFLPYKTEADATYAGLIGVHPLSFSAFRQAPWHHYSLAALEQTQIALRSPFLDNEFVKTVYRAPLSALSDSSISLRLIADGDAALGKIPTDRGLIHGDAGMPAKLRNSFIEFTVKAEYAYDYGMPQWFVGVDRVLSPLHLERLFLGRHKFYHFRYWYRHLLGDYVKSVLLDPKTLARPFFDGNGLKQMVSSHLRGEGNHTLGIHKALSVELLHRQLIDG